MNTPETTRARALLARRQAGAYHLPPAFLAAAVVQPAGWRAWSGS